MRNLASEIQSELASPWVEELDPYAAEMMARFLSDLRLEAVRPVEALDGLERAGASASAWLHAGYSLENGHEDQLARRALRRACELDPDLQYAFDELSKVDPAAALAVLDRRPSWYRAQGRVGEARLRAALLVRSGDERGAIAVLRGVLDASELPQGYWDELRELAPDVASTDLVQRSRERTDRGTMLAYVADLLAREDGPSAIRYLADLSLGARVDEAVLVRLAELDPERLGFVLAERTARMPDDAHNWDRLGDWTAEHGRAEAAFQAWWRSFEIDPDMATHADELWLQDPVRALRILARKVEAATDDEVWGDYGDRLWVHGSREDARAAWETARALDPDDDEWSAKLDASSAGRWPL